jgi:hypothetical protein
VLGRVVVALCLLWGASSPAHAQEHAHAPLVARHVPRAAYGTAVFGFVSAGLMLGGSIAIAVDDAGPRERQLLSRGLLLGYTALAVPAVAVGGLVIRRRAEVEGLPSVRMWGWVSYVGALLNGVLQVVVVERERPVGVGLTLAAGGLAALGASTFAFDALLSARRAHARRLYGLELLPSGVRVRF